MSSFYRDARKDKHDYDAHSIAMHLNALNAEFVACDARHIVKSFGEYMYSRYLILYIK